MVGPQRKATAVPVACYRGAKFSVEQTVDGRGLIRVIAKSRNAKHFVETLGKALGLRDGCHFSPELMARLMQQFDEDN
jgi:hypothetical protein